MPMPSANDYITGVLLNPNKQQQHKPQQPPPPVPPLSQPQQQQQEYSPYFSANALRTLCKNLDNLNDKMRNIDYDDKLFLKIFLNNPLLKDLIDCHDTISNSQELDHKPVEADSISLIKSILSDINQSDRNNKDINELNWILNSNLHLRSIIEAHDTIAQQAYEGTDDDLLNLMLQSGSDVGAGASNGALNDTRDTLLPYYASPPIDAIRMIGVRKVNDEPLGITVRVNDNGDLEIARIMHGGLIDKQGLLHEGDIIKEVNGEVVLTPDDLQDKLKQATGSVTFKVVPSFYDIPLASQVYMKALFSYDPLRDKLIPAKDAGLTFQQGDILQIISQEDIHWWQARHVKAPHLKGLIPSLYLEERRKAFVPPENDFSKSSWVCGLIDRKKKKKFLFNAKEHSLLDKADLKLYEEVARMPPFQRKTLVLVGAEGVGRRTLKTKLLNLDPDRFGTTIPHTSRAKRADEENGRGYYFEARATMERDIHNGDYLEWGEYNENLYGTKLETIKHVIQSGKMCIIDCSVKSLKLLTNQEFMPYIVFIKCPESIDDLYNMKIRAKNANKMKNQIVNQSILNINDEDLPSVLEESETIENDYHAYFDAVLVNDDMSRSFASLVDHIDALKAEAQWVPVTWLY